MRARVPVSVLEFVELLVTRAMDVNISIHRGEAGGVEEKPWMTRKMNVPLSFETGRPPGFIPTFRADINSDGFHDFLTFSSQIMSE